MSRLSANPGDRIGILTVVCDTGKRFRERAVFELRCDCGNTIERYLVNLKRARAASCGCLTRGLIREARTTHGHSVKEPGKERRTFVKWMSMHWRCTNQHRADYPRYGGRGIVVCERWFSFDAFLEDMGYADDGMSLDRINNDGDYEPGNCRWATTKEQACNKRTNHFVTHDGHKRTLSQWSEITGIARDTLRLRIVNGWSVERALGVPTMRRGLVKAYRAFK